MVMHTKFMDTEEVGLIIKPVKKLNVVATL